MEDEEFAESPEITQAIGASADRIEAALDDLFLLRTVYIFEAAREEVSVLVEDLMNLLLETDFR
ncbi:MAG: hypothetical protein ACU0E9_12065 [Limimaricola soesokkakensis]|uniref:hypothetical protein n=1 Tax=Limimaricola soesokkakensis TaxID=1343159 RepID=UPI0040591D8F